MIEETTLQATINKGSKSVILFGILLLLLGILAVAYPSGIGKFSTVIIGVFLIVGGVLRMAFAVLSISMGSMFLRYLYAILMLCAGVWIILNPDMGLEALTISMAIYFIIDGISEIVYSFGLMPIGGGWYLLMSGLVSLLLGILIFSRWPESSEYAIGLYLGIKLIIDGLMITATGYAVRKSAKAM